MTGPEHYREAERLLAATAPDAEDPVTSFERLGALLAGAQVHATLALAAATALNDAEGGTGINDWNAWNDAASINKRPGSPEVTA